MEELTVVFKKLHADAPVGSCSLDFPRPDPRDDKSPTAIITPFSSRSARIHARFQPGFGVYLTLGMASVFEVPLKGKRYIGLEMLEEVQQLGRAVIEQGFVEYVVRAGEKVIGATGELEVLGKKGLVSESWMRIGLGLFKKKTRTRYEYERYKPA